MRIKTLFAAGMLAAAMAGVHSGASAQGIEFGPGGIRVDPGFERRGPPPPRYDGISEREAIRIARRQGLVDVDRVRETPRGWVVAGADRRGDDMRVIISRDGDVIDVR